MKMIQAENVKKAVQPKLQAIVANAKKEGSGNHKRVWFLICFFAIICIIGSFFFTRPSIEELYQKGMEYYEDSLYKEAIPYLKNAADHGYSDAQCVLWLFAIITA